MLYPVVSCWWDNLSMSWLEADLADDMADTISQCFDWRNEALILGYFKGIKFSYNVNLNISIRCKQKFLCFSSGGIWFAKWRVHNNEGSHPKYMDNKFKFKLKVVFIASHTKIGHSENKHGEYFKCMSKKMLCLEISETYQTPWYWWSVPKTPGYMHSEINTYFHTNYTE